MNSVAICAKAIIVLLLFSPPSILGQQSTQPANPCNLPEVKAFDFQIGVWKDESGVQIHEVKKILGGCVIQENWKNAKGDYAIALKSYDARAGRWQLSWVAPEMNHQFWEGRKEEGQWRFYRRWQMDGEAILSRTYWVLVDDGTVERIVEQSRDDGKSWRLHVKHRFRKTSQN
jgi:hypothetical protein